MELSIIIVNWNTKKLVLDCVKSIYKHPPKVNFEVIVVDNASSDGSVEALKKLKKVKLVENNENQGFNRANNQGISKAQGSYILLLNSDTEVKEGSIDKLLSFATKNKNIGVVIPKLLNTDGTTQGSVFRFPNLLRTIRQYWFGEKGLLDKYSPKKESKVEVGVMAAFLITPKALKLGGLNEDYFMYFEDLDYCRKLRKNGLDIYFLPDAEVVHHHGASGKNLAGEAEQWKRLIPSSKVYHGLINHYLIISVMWSAQKLKGWLIPLLLVLLITPSFLQLTRSGYFPMQDALQAFRVHQMDRCFDDGQIPCRWVPDAGYQYGYPQFNYYPPAPYYLGVLLHRVGFQYIDSVKILFIAGYILSALAMYVLVNSLLGRWPGLVAAVAYTYIPYKAVEVYVRGALSEFWAQIFFPLILWAIYMLVKSGKVRHLLWLSLGIALLATTHLLMTIIFIPIAGVWALYWLFRFGWGNFRKVVVAGLLGFGLSSFFVIPVAFERQFVHLESLLSGYFDYRQHFVSLHKIFLSMEWGYGSSGFPDEKLNLSVGIIHWIFAFVIGPALAILVRKRYKKMFPLVVMLTLLALASIFMMHLRSSYFWSLVPFLWFLQFPWRFMAVSIFLVTLLIGFVIKFSGKYQYLAGIALFIISFSLYYQFFVPKSWLNITDADNFSGESWEKQLTISIFDYLPIYATLPPNHKAPKLPEVLVGRASFASYEKGSNFQKGMIIVEEDATLRLPIFDFPGMVVRVDGREVPHRNDDCSGEEFCFGLITFNIGEGEHDIEVRLTNTPPRVAGNLITLGSVGVVGFLLVGSSLGKSSRVQSKRHAKISS